MKRFLKGKYQSLVDSISNAKHYFQGKYQSLKDSISRKIRFLVRQYERFRDSRFVKTIKSTFKFLYSYALPISASFILTELMSRIRMPAYMMVLQNIGEPRSAYFVLGSSILIPTLVGTKLFRVSKALHQKYFAKNQADAPSPENILSNSEEAAQPEVTRSLQQFKQASHPEEIRNPMLLARLEKEQNASQPTLFSPPSPVVSFSPVVRNNILITTEPQIMPIVLQSVEQQSQQPEQQAINSAKRSRSEPIVKMSDSVQPDSDDSADENSRNKRRKQVPFYIT